MKVSDYVIQFLEERGVTDVFGYPGVGCGHFMNSLKDSSIRNHLVYNEQGAAFAACSYAQATCKTGIAYSTAGPGATNLVTGIANAYVDSIPTVFIIGEKDLASLKGAYKVRQLASQEVDIVNLCKPISKLSFRIEKAGDVKKAFEKAFYCAHHGRPGPVVIDFPSDIQRSEIEPLTLKSYLPEKDITPYKEIAGHITECINNSKKPLLLIGNGVKQLNLSDEVLQFCKNNRLPLVTTLVCCDVYAGEKENIGYLGMDGDRSANLAVQNADLIITLGARLNFKQVGYKRDKFAVGAKLIRVDCDEGELSYGLRDEERIKADLKYLIPELLSGSVNGKDGKWLDFCEGLKEGSFCGQVANETGAVFIRAISDVLPENVSIVTDTGSHRRWVMNGMTFKKGQRFFQSAGLASMGYAIPAAIGAYYGLKRKVVCFEGDGGLMMNLQELQMIKRDRLPITVVVLNNNCLGDIMEFQKKIFKNTFSTTTDSGYLPADIKKIAAAFGFNYISVDDADKIKEIDFSADTPQIVEITVKDNRG